MSEVVVTTTGIVAAVLVTLLVWSPWGAWRSLPRQLLVQCAAAGAASGALTWGQYPLWTHVVVLIVASAATVDAARGRGAAQDPASAARTLRSPAPTPTFGDTPNPLSPHEKRLFMAAVDDFHHSDST